MLKKIKEMVRKKEKQWGRRGKVRKIGKVRKKRER